MLYITYVICYIGPNVTEKMIKLICNRLFIGNFTSIYFKVFRKIMFIITFFVQYVFYSYPSIF